MKRIGILSLLLAALLLSVWSCDDDYVSEMLRSTSTYYDFSLDERSFEVNGRAVVKTVQINASYDMEWTFEDVPSWILVSPASGTGSQTVRLAISRNTSGRRYAMMHILSKDPDWPAYLSLEITQDEAATMEYVDLGLSVNWATCNVDATSPEEQGGYYAWGETDTKNIYNAGTYKWYDGSSSNITKYNDPSDGKYVLEPEDDIAQLMYADSWRMPTFDEWTELLYFCDWTLANRNGVDGYLIESNVTGFDGKSIFLPAQGFKADADLQSKGGSGLYWCSDSYHGYSSQYALCLFFDDDELTFDLTNREYGLAVRAVSPSQTWPGITAVSISQDELTLTKGCVAQLEVLVLSGNNDYSDFVSVSWDSQNKDVATVSQSGLVTAISPGTAVITAQYDGMVSNCVITVQEYNPVCEYVDLGLSVYWATCNVGAQSPEDNGMYVSWGEISPKESYSSHNYKWYSDDDKFLLTKYCTNAQLAKNGKTDGMSVLELSDDFAHSMWGDKWRTPSKSEFEELCTKCTWTMTQVNGVQGYIVTSNVDGYTDKSIFLPITGWIGNGSHQPDYICYWTNQVYPNSQKAAYALFEQNSLDRVARTNGVPVRPVYNKEHEYVDMGVSVKWAKTNIGASTPEDYGYYFKWGETEPRQEYDWKNYKWANGTTTSITKYNTQSSFGTVDDKTYLESADDAARVLWGDEWRMPKYSDFKELRDNCTWTWKLQNGVYGYEVTADNGNSIFLPAAGSYGADYMGNMYTSGYYWYDMLYSSQPDCAWNLGFNPNEIALYCVTGRGVCASIRPVRP